MPYLVGDLQCSNIFIYCIFILFYFIFSLPPWLLILKNDIESKFFRYCRFALILDGFYYGFSHFRRFALVDHIDF